MLATIADELGVSLEDEIGKRDAEMLRGLLEVDAKDTPLPANLRNVVLRNGLKAGPAKASKEQSGEVIADAGKAETHKEARTVD